MTSASTPEPSDPADLVIRNFAAEEGYTAELVQMDPPLRAACVARVGQHVQVHIVGGMVVEGTLSAIEDDLTIVITDRTHRFDVALSAIAILQGGR